MRRRWGSGHRVAIGVLVAVAGLLCCCAGANLFGDGPQPVIQPVQMSPSATVSATPEPEYVEESEEPEDDSVYYANCDQVRRAGQAPLYIGEPGYRKGLDRDGDGKACDR